MQCFFHSHQFSIFNQIYSTKVEISDFRGGKDIKPQEIQNTSIKLCHQKVAYQGRMCVFSTILIEKSFCTIFMRYDQEIISTNWYNKATA